MSTISLLRERDIMLNTALGAHALWAFTCGFERKRLGGDDPVLSLWHLLPTLPMVFHGVSRRAINKRLERSGLRSILNRDPGNDIAQNEAIFNLQSRVVMMKERTFRSLNLALTSGLISLADGNFRCEVPFSLPTSTPTETKEVLKAAEKLGAWAGELGVFEYLTVLGVEPIL